MAVGKKKGGGRKEPQFGLGPSLAALRLSPQDRIPGADEEKPKKTARKIAPDHIEDDDPPPKERKPKPQRIAGKGRAGSRIHEPR